MPGRYRGVTQRGNGWQISFTLPNGERRRETLRFPLTRKGEDEAHRVRSTVLMEIDKGTFDYGRTFPRSRGAVRYSSNPGAHVSIEQALKEYLRDHEPHLAKSTLKDYSDRTYRHLIPQFGHLMLTELRAEDVRRWLHEIDLSNQAKNNILIPLRGVFKRAFAEEMIGRDPLARIKALPIRSREPDPFTRAEIRAVLSELERRAPKVRAYFQFAFATGLRTSELLGLDWEDIDLVRARVRVCRALVRDSIKEPKTTAGRRMVDLSSEAVEALEVLRSDVPRGRIFLDPRKDLPWRNEQALRKVYWYPTLEKLHLKKRNPYQTRHTFASQLLSDGANPMYVAQQMGHRDWGMIRKVYGRYIVE